MRPLICKLKKDCFINLFAWSGRSQIYIKSPLILESRRRIALERINILSYFCKSNIGNNFAFSKFWPRSHQTKIPWPKVYWLIHMSITNPSCSRRNWKKSRANCYTRTDHFFLLAFMRCGWRLRYFWWLRYLRWEENFSSKLFFLQIAASITVPRVRITDIWVKVELRFASPKRKRVRWKKKILPSHAKYKRTKVFFS